MFDVRNPLVQIKITSATCSSVAIAITLYRLYIRRTRLWYDDAWAFLSMIILFIQITGVFLHVPHPADLPRTSRIAAYYLMAVAFYGIIWFARLSILFSIIRLDPSEARRRRLRYIAALFFTVAVVLIAQLFWVCEPEPRWKNAASPQCKLNKQVAISQLITDIISDSILLIAPLKLLSGLEDKGLRRRLIIIFSTCIVTTIVSLVHAAYILHNGAIKVVISGLVEDNLSLIVASVPVVVTASIRLREDHQHSSRSNTRPLSTFFSFATFTTTTAAAHTEVKSSQTLSNTTSGRGRHGRGRRGGGGGSRLGFSGRSLGDATIMTGGSWDHSHITSGTSETTGCGGGGHIVIDVGVHGEQSEKEKEAQMEGADDPDAAAV